MTIDDLLNYLCGDGDCVAPGSPPRVVLRDQVRDLVRRVVDAETATLQETLQATTAGLAANGARVRELEAKIRWLGVALTGEKVEWPPLLDEGPGRSEDERHELKQRVRELEAELRCFLCSFCGHRESVATGRDFPAAMADHMLACERHPIRVLKDRVRELEGRVAELRAWHDVVQYQVRAWETVYDELLRAGLQPGSAVGSNGIEAATGFVRTLAARVAELEEKLAAMARGQAAPTPEG